MPSIRLWISYESTRNEEQFTLNLDAVAVSVIVVYVALRSIAIAAAALSALASVSLRHRKDGSSACAMLQADSLRNLLERWRSARANDGEADMIGGGISRWTMTFERPWSPSLIEPAVRASLGFAAVN